MGEIEKKALISFVVDDMRRISLSSFILFCCGLHVIHLLSPSYLHYEIFRTAAITIQSTLTTHSPMMILGIGGPIDYQDDHWHAYQENLLLSITTFTSFYLMLMRVLHYICALLRYIYEAHLHTCAIGGTVSLLILKYCHSQCKSAPMAAI